MDFIPTYKSKPDLKDCQYVLGRFCEEMIKSGKYEFTRDVFLLEFKRFCADKLIELDVDLMFDVLEINSIIARKGSNFCFRFSYWIFYFAAKRMHVEPDFATYIFENDRYTSFPEIIEFYTGIDRNRNDALKILTEDIRNTCDIVANKVGLPDDMNPFRLAKWQPTEDSIDRMQKEIGDDVINSNLPDSLKDQYADKSYNQMRPYNQTINTIMRDYSLALLVQKVKASSRALRNSDYAEPSVKRALIKEIIRSWEQISKVQLALSPILANEGHADFEGATFYLTGDFGQTFEKRLNNIIKVTPKNIVRFFKSDLYSNKIGPLLYDQIATEESEFKKHQLMLLIAYEMPKDWKKHLEDYIISIPKNSFYLSDIVHLLIAQHKFAFVSKNIANEISYLAKLGLAKHKFGDKKPKLDKLRQISLPKREVSDSEEKDDI